MSLIDRFFEPIEWVIDTVLSKPPDEPNKNEPLSAIGNSVINGIELSQTVIDQLRIAGFNPAWCNPYELAAAQRSAAMDCDVFDEDDGDGFFDKLTLDGDEIATRENKTAPPKAPPPPTAIDTTFCARLQLERANHNGAETLWCG